MENLNQLIEISRQFGTNPDYIIAGGGNSSYKDDERMWVKASGTSMGVIDKDGFVCLDRHKMKVISERHYSANPSQREEEVKQDLHNAILYPEGKRPSVEASMHEIIPFAYVMHTHPTLVNGVLCAQNSRQVIQELFGDDVVYLPYTDPGYVLFKDVEEALNVFRNEKGKDAQIIFLENHGVFVRADSCEEVKNIYKLIEEKINGALLSALNAENNNEVSELETLAESLSKVIGGEVQHFVCDQSLLSRSFVENESTFPPVSIPFTPDNIVYCKSKYLYLSNGDNYEDRVRDFTARFDYAPKLIAIEGKGLIALEESQKSAQIVMDVFKDMMKVARLTESFGGARPMTPEQIEFIDNWEVENYRRQMSKQS
ncbi:class II aldolase/adducin family protein [Carboxylicivirga sp. RSCT41]|uniref:class II aldolase/adducin family protein n=1 Tax=Carboxylicivirga agarovorans TaxID=3417570 RepID=UPI003D337A89